MEATDAMYSREVSATRTKRGGVHAEAAAFSRIPVREVDGVDDDGRQPAVREGLALQGGTRAVVEDSLH